VGWFDSVPIAPRGETGIIGETMNFLDNLMGAGTSVTTGCIVGATGSLVAGMVLV